MSDKPLLYVSIDCETSGPCPPDYAMLSIGGAAFEFGNEKPISTSYIKLRMIDGQKWHPDTWVFWHSEEQKEAFAELMQGQHDPDFATLVFYAWMKRLEKDHTLVFSGYPTTYDFQFFNYYLHRFCGANPLGWRGFDLRSYAAGVLGCGFLDAKKESELLAPFRPKNEQPHNALEDAIEQGIMIVRLMKKREEDGRNK